MKAPENEKERPLCFTAQEVAGMLNVNRKTVYRLCARGRLHRAKALRTLRIPRWSVEQFLRGDGE